MRSDISALLLLSLASAQALHAQPHVAIRGATVIDGTGAPPRPKQTVLIRGDRIAAFGPTDAIRIPAGARVIDGAGKFLLPGFIDVHAHFSLGATTLDTMPSGIAMHVERDHAGGVESLQTLLAFGVTTIRNPAGSAQEAVAMRDSVRLGYLRGPRIFTAGEAIDGFVGVDGLSVAAKTESDVRREVARQAALGVDYVKLYASLGPALVRAGIDEAHKRGVRAIAHLFLTSWTDAANAGIDGLVHIAPGSPLLLPAAKRADFQRRFRGTQFMLEWFNYVDLESAEIREMIAALVSHQVFLDPTLVMFEAMAWGDSARVVESPDLVLTPSRLLANWRGGFTLATGWKPQDYEDARRAWPIVLAFTKRLYESGVQLTAGTDMMNPWIVPGASFHRELELLAAAGIPNVEVLRIATRNGARSLGIEGDVGSIATGKVADMVLLSADPIADIRNTRKIAMVIQGGRPSTPQSLLPPRLRGMAGARR